MKLSLMTQVTVRAFLKMQPQPLSHLSHLSHSGLKTFYNSPLAIYPMQKTSNTEVQSLGKNLSFETLTKIQIRIHRIRMYYGNFKKVAALAGVEPELVYQPYFIAIAVLYRSLFKALDKGYKINVERLGIMDYPVAMENHQSLINIVDKDLAHLDKNSKSHKILSASARSNTRSMTIVSSQISYDRLNETIGFLSRVVEPAIQEATSISIGSNGEYSWPENHETHMRQNHPEYTPK